MTTTYHNTGLNISQSASSSFTTLSSSGEFLTAGTGETLILKSIQVANDTKPSGSTYYDTNICVKLQDSSTTLTHSLAYFMVVPKYASVDVLSDNLVLEPNDKITIQITGSSERSIVYSVSAVGSYLKMT